MLEHQESGPLFSTSGVALGHLQLMPLLRALKLQTTIQQLVLSGTRLGDDVAEELRACMDTLPRLKVLNLSANQLGPEGLRKLSAGLSGSSPWPVCGRGELVGAGSGRCICLWKLGRDAHCAAALNKGGAKIFFGGGELGTTTQRLSKDIKDRLKARK